MCFGSEHLDDDKSLESEETSLRIKARLLDYERVQQFRTDSHDSAETFSKSKQGDPIVEHKNKITKSDHKKKKQSVESDTSQSSDVRKPILNLTKSDLDNKKQNKVTTGHGDRLPATFSSYTTSDEGVFSITKEAEIGQLQPIQNYSKELILNIPEQFKETSTKSKSKSQENKKNIKKSSKSKLKKTDSNRTESKSFETKLIHSKSKSDKTESDRHELKSDRTESELSELPILEIPKDVKTKKISDISSKPKKSKKQSVKSLNRPLRKSFLSAKENSSDTFTSSESLSNLQVSKKMNKKKIKKNQDKPQICFILLPFFQRASLERVKDISSVYSTDKAIPTISVKNKRCSRMIKDDITYGQNGFDKNYCSSKCVDSIDQFSDISSGSSTELCGCSPSNIRSKDILNKFLESNIW